MIETSNYQTIYDRLRSNGLTEAGALGMIGNWECESNCEPGRLQGDFSPYRNNSKAYVSGVTSGSITRDQFARDSKGFGLAQWTYYSRKYQLYDFWRASGQKLDSAELQADFAVKELKEGYTGLLDTLKTSNDLYTCVKLICTQFERPAINNIDARFAAAQRIKEQIYLKHVPADKPKPTDQGLPKWATMPVWAPGNLEKGSFGAEVVLLQALLTCHDYYCDADGVFGNDTLGMVEAFQTDAGLPATGKCDKETWMSLGIRMG